MTLDEWIEIGVSSGFCSQPDCQTHNPVPMTPEEDNEFNEGGDPCICVVRIWTEGKPDGST